MAARQPTAPPSAIDPYASSTELLASLVIRLRGPVRTAYPFSSMAIAADSQLINNFIDGAGECTY
jgi:hypothetical protein